MGLSAAEVAKVRTAAALHDVGKLHTPRTILNKPGRLTDEEFAQIRLHPVDGAAMSLGLDDPTITAVIRHHHERLDGAGYPAGLAGEDIPLGCADHRRRRHVRRDDVQPRLPPRHEATSTHSTCCDRKPAASSTRGRSPRSSATTAAAVGWSGRPSRPRAPQRLFAWLGGISPGLGAGAAGAASLAIGLGVPQPVVSPAAAAPRPAAARAQSPAHAPAPVSSVPHAARAGATGHGPPRSRSRPVPGKRSHPQAQRRTDRQTHRAQAPASQGNAPAAVPQNVTAQPVKPQKVKPQKVKPPKPPAPAAKPERVKPPKPPAPAAKPEHVKLPKPPAARGQAGAGQASEGRGHQRPGGEADAADQKVLGRTKM